MEEFRNICSKVKFQNIGDERGGPLGVWPGPLYIESSI